jgi:hypothetical protein
MSARHHVLRSSKKETAMLTLGVVLLGGALLALPQAALIFRSPSPPNWTRWVWAEEVVGMLIVCALIFGLGAVIAGGYAAYSGGVSVIYAALAGVLAGLFVWIRQRLGLGARVRALDAQPTSMPVVPGGAASPAAPATPGDVPSPQPHAPGRQAA